MSPPAPRLTERSRAALVGVVGPAHLLTDPELTGPSIRDWTGRFVGTTPAVVRPADCAEVAGVLAHCRDAGLAVVPQGGNTGLVGGSVPLHGEVVIDLRRLDQIGPVDRLARQVTAGAGATVAAVHAAAADHGLGYAVDFAARDTATVGGTVATNAGGVHVLRWGMTRAQVVGIEAVLSDGRVLSHLGGLGKDNTGYDLAGLLCGSEGTLAVITAARLRLVPLEADRCVALVGFASVGEAVSAVARLTTMVPGLTAAELMLADGIDLVCSSFDRRPPFAPPGHRAVVLVEARADHLGAAAAALEAAVADDPSVAASVVATDAPAARALWAYRDDHTLAVNTLGPPHKLDVTLPLGRLAGFVDQLPARVAAIAPHAGVWQFGHLGDGNIHVNLSGLDPDDESADAVVLDQVIELGGSISAEHGIGSAKRAWLARSRSNTEIEAFRAIKQALDPAGILNPGVLLPGPSATDPGPAGPPSARPAGRS